MNLCQKTALACPAIPFDFEPYEGKQMWTGNKAKFVTWIPVEGEWKLYKETTELARIAVL
jgi:hypothetical protein